MNEILPPPSPRKPGGLSDQQKAFVDALFSEAHFNDFEFAKKYAGYSPRTQIQDILVGKLAEAITQMSEYYLALHAPSAVHSLVSILRDPSSLGANNMLAAANSILDRAGLGKKEKQEIKIEAPNAILVLPPKKTINIIEGDLNP